MELYEKTLSGLEDVEGLTKAWLEGVEVDWNEVYGGDRPHRISIPTQPLEDKVFTAKVNERAVTIIKNKEANLENVITVLKQKISEILQCQEEEVEIDEPFIEYGLDSVNVVTLIDELNALFCIKLSTTVIYDYPSIKQMTQYMMGKFKPAIISYFKKDKEVTEEKKILVQDEKVERKEKSHTGECHKEPIAIIGISGRFADSDNIEELWQHLIKGEDLVTYATKWPSLNQEVDGEKKCRSGSFIKDIASFDPLFFNISGLEATYMDPQQRLFLEESWKALEDAGYVGESIKGKKCGVYVGCTMGDYQDLLEDERPVQALWGNMSAIVPTRIAYLLNLKGPAIAVDTACSSSLVAMHLACQSLWCGETEMALVGGSYLQCTPKMYMAGNKGGMLSATGHCHTFDQAADGFVPGDGVAAIVLKPLAKAIQDGDHIYGAIIGSGINQDGATNGITAPSGKAQEALEKDIYEAFDINPKQIQMVEAHGTGTKLGDPIEFEALTRAFREYTDEKQFCAIGSMKTNIGHTQHASGVAGVLKVLLALKYKKMPPSLHFKEGNANIDFENSPFYVNTQAKEWERDKDNKRCGVVSSFGFSGTNAHVVLEEVEIHEAPHETDAPYVIALSARSLEQLKEQVRQLISFCHKNKVDMGNMSYTLLKGRQHFDWRLACIAKDESDLALQLEAWIQREEMTATLYTGHLMKNKHINDVPIEGEKDLEDIAKSFTKGAKIDDEYLFKKGKYNRISLPTYPFAKNHYWVATENVEEPQVIHPLVHEYVNEVDKMLFKSHFTGNEFFFKDHRIGEDNILPGAAYLEMIQEAMQQLAAKKKWQVNNINIYNVTWLRPISMENHDSEIMISFENKNPNEFSFKVYKESNKTEEIVFSQGTVRLNEEQVVDNIKLDEEINRYEVADFDANKFYQTLANLGVQYGESYQCIKKVYARENEVLAQISLPESLTNTLQQFKLHPCLIDAVFQSVILAVGQGKSLEQMSPALLFALQKMEIMGACSRSIWAKIKYSEGSKPGDEITKFDIQLLNQQGDIFAQIEKVSSKSIKAKTNKPNIQSKTPINLVGNIALVPTWKVVSVTLQQESNDQFIAIIGGTPQLRSEIALNFKNSVSIEMDAGGESIIESFKKNPNIEHIIWIEDGENKLRNNLELIRFFKCAKTIINLGYGKEKLKWTIITTRAQQVVKGDLVNVNLAAIHGLIGSMAKEQPNWQIRLVDLETRISVEGFKEVIQLPYDKRGGALVNRQGHWLRQEVMPIEEIPSNKKAFEMNGTYIIIGGAGAIGTALSSLLVKRYQANVIWIGRRKLDSAIEEKINGFKVCGKTPVYFSADAASGEELSQVVENVKQKYGRINGVIHAAQVFNSGSVEEIQEVKFVQAIDSKNSVAQCIGEVFEQEDIDFILFFSSINAYSKAPGQGAYSASCVFLDTFAKELNQRCKCDVKVINWGYFKNNIDQKDFLAKTGYGLLEPEEILAGIELLLTSSLEQMSYVKTTSDIGLKGLNLSQCNATYYKEEFENIVLEDNRDAVLPKFPNEMLTQTNPLNDKMEEILYQFVWCKFTELGLFNRPVAMEEIIQKTGVEGFYIKWLEEMIRLLVEQGFLSKEEDLYRAQDKERLTEEEIWQEWQTQKEVWMQYPALQAQEAVVVRIMRELVEIIQGKKLATEVMFPQSSMHLMEALYKTNVAGHYFNELLTSYVITYIQAAIMQNPERKIRIIEIGAGTGGTSVVLFEKLKPFKGYIEEYCYTDISKAFLIHAQETYASENPYLTYGIFNLEQPVINQDIKVGYYDIAVASNCVHATSDICESIRNVKAVLKENGILLLNEMTGNNLFSHLTFGMLEGWWLYKDANLRIQGCPGIDKEVWKQLLSLQGFKETFLPYDVKYDSKQEIIISKSDGIICQRQVVKEEKVQVKSTKSKVLDHDLNKKVYEQVLDLLKEKVAECLKIDITDIESDVDLVDYGVDSILSVSLVKEFNEALAIDMEITILFEYTTLESLTEYILENFKESLQQKFGTMIDEVNETEVVEVEEMTSSRQVNALMEEERAPKAMLKEVETLRELVEEDIAIVGISAKLPMADTLDAYWNNIEEGKSCIREIPAERRMVMQQFGGNKAQEMQSKYAGLIEDIDKFDPKFFGILEAEATSICPELRLLLTYTWNALEDAGVTSRAREQENVGIFVCSNSSEYRCDDNSMDEEQAFAIPTNMSGSMMANQISYYLDLKGPSECCETGCSSVLVAVHRAIQALHNEECDSVVISAVNLLLSEAGFENMEALGLIAKDGKSRSFQPGAEGFVRSEGVGAIVLKPYTKAVADHDNIYAVIKGSSINHGGKGASFATPNMLGMKKAILNAYKKAHITFEDVDYIEAHGIGNALADSIEVAAFKSAFKELNKKNINNSCTISCLKPTIGHGEIVSGLSAIIKAVLALKHKVIPGITNFERLNEDITFKDTPFTIVKENREWTKPTDASGNEKPRIATVNSYGLGGVNGHIVLEEYEAPKYEVLEENEYMVVLSGKSQLDVKHYASKLLNFIETHEEIRLADLSYNLQVCRDSMKERLAMIVGSKEMLINMIQKYLKDETDDKIIFGSHDDLNKDIKVLFVNEVKQNIIDTLFKARDLRRLALYWVKIGDVSWDELYKGKVFTKISMPTYAFNEKSYWPEVKPQVNLQEKVANSSQSNKNKIEDVEKSVLEIISKFIGIDVEKINLNNSIQEYGIDSIRVIPLLQRIQSHIEESVSLKDLSDKDTIQEITQCIKQKYEESSKVMMDKNSMNKVVRYPELVRLNDVSVGQPVFWIHAALGGVETYKEVAENCKRPFLGIQARGWMNSDSPLQGINEMSAYYAQIIQTIQPEGPYDIGGFCLGGILAYEVTRILQGRGCKVNSIVMIDSPDNTFQKMMIESKCDRQDSKDLFFQTVNMLLYGQLRDKKSKEELFISKEELDLNVSDEEFLKQLTKLAIVHGLPFSESQVLESITNNADVQLAYNLPEYRIRDLHNKGDIQCYYFRNKSGVFEGELKKYLTLPGNTFEFDGKVYWEQWKQQFEKIDIIDVEASSHMSLMHEQKAIERILDVCSKLY